MKEGKEPEYDDSKYNAGIDAEKRAMELFKKIDMLTNQEIGESQKAKYTLVKQLCLATRGLFNDKKVREDIWERFNRIKLNRGNISRKEGKTRYDVVYNSTVDKELDDVIILVTDYLQDEKGFFSPVGDEPGL